MSGDAASPPVPGAFDKLPALARRLGVEPRGPEGHPPSILLTTGNGVSYDLFDLVNAALDRVDAAVKE